MLCVLIVYKIEKSGQRNRVNLVKFNVCLEFLIRFVSLYFRYSCGFRQVVSPLLMISFPHVKSLPISWKSHFMEVEKIASVTDYRENIPFDVAVGADDVADVFDAAESSKYFVGTYGANCGAIEKRVVGIGWHLDADNAASVPNTTVVGATIAPHGY